jgi:hypothetical protein
MFTKPCFNELHTLNTLSSLNIYNIPCSNVSGIL